MKTIKLFASVLLSAAVFALASCNPKEEFAPGFDTANFIAEATAVGDYTATIEVTVANDNNSPWYGFLTDDVTSKPEDVVANYVKTLSVTKHILKSGPDKIELADLKAGKDYRYIVTGLTATGATYGVPGVAAFTTTGDFIYSALEENPDVTVTIGSKDDPTTKLTIAGVGEGYYDFAFMPKDEFEATYESAEEWVFAQIDTVHKYNTEFGKLLKSGDKTHDTGVLFTENIDYAVVVYPVTGNYNAKGTYTLATVQRKTYTEVKMTYEKWLGVWELNAIYEGAPGLDTLTIEEKTAGETYTISGLNGGFGEFPFEAKFDSESGRLQIYGQDNIAVYGPYNIGIIGRYRMDDGNYSITWNSTPYMVTEVQNRDTGVAAYLPGMIDIGNGDEPLTGFSYCAFQAGEFKGSLKGAYEYPITMKRIGDLAPFVAKYEDWLGYKKVARGEYNDTWNITVKENGVSYSIDGIEGMGADEGLTVTADFDSATGELVFNNQKIGEVYPYDFGSLGVLNLQDGLFGSYPGEEYDELVDGEYEIARAVLEKDLSFATFKGNKVSVDGEEIQLTQMGYGSLVVDGDYSGIILSFSDVLTPFTSKIEPISIDNNYSMYLNNWDLFNPDSTPAESIKLAIDSPNETYAVTGLAGSDAAAYAEYNKADMSVDIWGGLDYPVMEEVDLGVPDVTFSVCLVGYVVNGADTIRVDGGDYKVANISRLGASGAEMTGVKVGIDTDEDGVAEYYRTAFLGYMAISEDENEDVYDLAAGASFPASMARPASGTATRMGEASKTFELKPVSGKSAKVAKYSSINKNPKTAKPMPLVLEESGSIQAR